MAMQDEVSRIEGDVEEVLPDAKVLELAVQEVKQCLQATGDSLPKICNDIEGATSRSAIRAFFRRLNSVTQILLRLAPAATYADSVSKALCALEVSPRL